MARRIQNALCVLLFIAVVSYRWLDGGVAEFGHTYYRGGFKPCIGR